MKIVLKETLNERKGWVRGEAVDWPRATITQITETRKQRKQSPDWYEPADYVRRRTNARSIKRPRTKGGEDESQV